MDELRCEDVRQWIQQVVLSDDLTPPTPAIADHIASCPFCRGAFVLLAAEAINLPSLAAPTSCGQYETDMAAFIERELEEGSAIAIRTYPHVWWHLLTCEDCAETYRVTRMQVMSEQSQVPAIAKLAVSPIRRLARRAPLLQFQRHFLHQALAASIPARAATRGRGGQSYVLTEQERADTYLVLSVQRQANGEWSIDVVHRPPLIGSAVLTCGTHFFRARFNPQGRAAVHDVPFALLTAPDGPDLDIDIETDAE